MKRPSLFSIYHDVVDGVESTGRADFQKFFLSFIHQKPLLVDGGAWYWEDFFKGDMSMGSTCCLVVNHYGMK